MTRLSITDLPPHMRQQAMRKLAEQEKDRNPSKEGSHVSPHSFLSQGEDSKYHAQKTTAVLSDGTVHEFDSAKEAQVYSELLIRQKAGEISDLRIQVPYELLPKQLRSDGKTERSVKYIADFVYRENGKEKVIDVKGYKKSAAYATFVIKRKLMLWVHHIEIEEL